MHLPDSFRSNQPRLSAILYGGHENRVVAEYSSSFTQRVLGLRSSFTAELSIKQWTQQWRDEQRCSNKHPKQLRAAR
jgi:hypothetical protein